MNEHAESGHVDNDPTRNLADQRDKALEEHRQRVEDSEQHDAAADEPVAPEPVEVAPAAPERHQHSEYETEFQTAKVEDADLDADEREETDNA